MKSTYILDAINDRFANRSRNIRQLRAILILLLTIKLVVAILYCAKKIYNLITYTQFPAEIRYGIVTGALICGIIVGVFIILYVIAYIFVVFIFDRFYILLFAWIAIIEFIFVVIVAVTSLIFIIPVIVAKYSVAAGITSSTLLIVIATIISLLTLMSIIYSFKLAKLIKIEEGYQLY